MIRVRVFWQCCALLTCLGLAADGWGQIQVEGVVDRGVYADSVSFRVVREAGYDYSVRLDAVTVPAGFFISLDRPGFYELKVHRELMGGGGQEDALVRFVIRASERGDSEWGLPPFVPRRVINSAGAAFASGRLKVVLPSRYPTDLAIPVVAILEDESGAALRLNGVVRAPGVLGGAIQLRRGVGSTLLPGADRSGQLIFSAAVHSQRSEQTVQIEPATIWTEVSGVIDGAIDWGAGARIDVTDTLTVVAGGTLTVGSGSVVRLRRGVDLIVEGVLVVNGVPDEPVVFTAADPGSAWGGVSVAGAGALVEMANTIMTGGGGLTNWFFEGSGRGQSHRSEQPVLYVANGAQALLTQCYLIDNPGQGFHGEGGILMMTRCLVQRAVSGGRVNGGALILSGSHLMEFPEAGAAFASSEHDGLHLTGGSHSLSDSVIGWALDDGLDAGSGPGGSVTVTGCWFEACYHEGMGLSAGAGTRLVEVRDTVVVNCGQGIEAGAGDPQVLADHLVLAGNVVGARFGDGDQGAYNGLLRVTNSFLLGNTRDLWAMTWDDWLESVDQLEAQGNLLSEPNPVYANNFVWAPAKDGGLLDPFCPGDPAAPVGIGFASPIGQFEMEAASGRIEVGLSCFRSSTVSVAYEILTDGILFRGGTIEFFPGEIVKPLAVTVPSPLRFDEVRVVLKDAVGGEITGVPVTLFLSSSTDVQNLIGPGSEWKYLDDGSDQGAAWRDLGYDDGGWGAGLAPLGYGHGWETTVVGYGTSSRDKHATTYFRREFSVPDLTRVSGLSLLLQRDDGAVVYLNGNEIFRDNLPAGPVDYSTRANFSLDDAEALAWLRSNPSIGFLQLGMNILAVEVHQADPDGASIGFDLELRGRPSPPIRSERVDGQLLLFWEGTDFVLEEAATLAGPWAFVSRNSPVIIPADGVIRFFRLRQLIGF